MVAVDLFILCLQSLRLLLDIGSYCTSAILLRYDVIGVGARVGRPAEEALAVRCSIFPVLLRFRSAFMIFFTSCYASCDCFLLGGILVVKFLQVGDGSYVPGDAASTGQWQVLNNWAFASPSLQMEFSIAMWAIPWPMQLLIHLFTGICLLDYIGFGCLPFTNTCLKWSKQKSILMGGMWIPVFG